MPQVKPKLRKREVLVALAAGALAAGTAGAILLDDNDGPRVEHVVRIDDDDGGNVVAMDDRKSYEVGDFDTIAVVGPQDVVVMIGDRPSVRAEGSAGALARYEVVVEGGKLEIRPVEGSGDWSDLDDVTYYVTVPRLDEFVLGGTGDARIIGVKAESFKGTIAGTGELRVDALNVGKAEFNLVAAGDLVASGTTADLAVKIAGAGDVSARGLHSRSAKLDIAGAGDVELTVAERADISVFGAGDVDIAGGAQCTLSRVGTGEVSCNGVEIEG